jgi:hypothetical protein
MIASGLRESFPPLANSILALLCELNPGDRISAALPMPNSLQDSIKQDSAEAGECRRHARRLMHKPRFDHHL